MDILEIKKELEDSKKIAETELRRVSSISKLLKEQEKNIFVKGFQVGWLWKETESFYIYQFDQYSAWLGDIPEELKKEINLKTDFNVRIDGDIMRFDPEQKSFIKQKFGYHLSEIDDETAKIKRGHIFDVIAESVENGCLPFKPKKKDLKVNGENYFMKCCEYTEK